MIKQLIMLANELDRRGLLKEADYVDTLAKRAYWGEDTIGGIADYAGRVIDHGMSGATDMLTGAWDASASPVHAMSSALKGDFSGAADAAIEGVEGAGRSLRGMGEAALSIPLATGEAIRESVQEIDQYSQARGEQIAREKRSEK